MTVGELFSLVNVFFRDWLSLGVTGVLILNGRAAARHFLHFEKRNDPRVNHLSRA